MKSVAVFVVLCLGFVNANLKCEHKIPDIPQAWIDMDNSCTNVVRDHVLEELKAALQYLAMGAHFSRDQINRPGFANLFFKAASEEREHAIKLIHYLLMRGQLTSGVTGLINNYKLAPNVTVWTSGSSALKDALNLEASVTSKIRELIKVCEAAPAFNDYHLVDYLTGDFLTEQYEGQRDLAGKLSTLEKMTGQHGELGEFLFDKELL
ncbi:hypothetical protein ABEB36_002760 [Hypothenemus hampei]|uniref:Ferritin n=1 Tax=Hypothenemus hampei TaxID=57062 RepID=A0ABD1F6W2_HYPHA